MWRGCLGAGRFALTGAGVETGRSDQAGDTVETIGTSGVEAVEPRQRLYDVMKTRRRCAKRRQLPNTRRREMIYPGAVVIDTPGGSSTSGPPVKVKETFPEIEALAALPFSRCTHTKEKDCAVLSPHSPVDAPASARQLRQTPTRDRLSARSRKRANWQDKRKGEVVAHRVFNKRHNTNLPWNPGIQVPNDGGQQVEHFRHCHVLIRIRARRSGSWPWSKLTTCQAVVRHRTSTIARTRRSRFLKVNTVQRRGQNHPRIARRHRSLLTRYSTYRYVETQPASDRHHAGGV